MTLERAFWFAGVAAEVATLVVLVYRRAFKTFPIFTLCIAWGLIGDIGEYYAYNHTSPHTYLIIYMIGMAMDSLFQFGVLFEVSRSVLRPMAQFLPRWTPFAVGLLIIAICAVVWPLAKTPGYDAFPLQGRLLVHLQQTFSILRILFFLALAGCSQLLSIGWKDREFQIATGFGLYSMASVAVSVMHTHQVVGPQYHLLDQVPAGVYFCALIYWAYCFAQQEAARREFTPQMQSFLLAMAGTARSSRIELSKYKAPKDRDPDE